jgi:toxin-antitoxin system PIN domain toxin
LNGLAYLLDTNVWVAFAFASHPRHAQAGQAITQASTSRTATFCRATQQSFLRLITTPAVLRAYNARAFTTTDAVAVLHKYLALPQVAYRAEPAGLEVLWHRFASIPSASPKVWMDAYLAAFAIAANMTMVTLDKDFLSYDSEGLNLILL